MQGDTRSFFRLFRLPLALVILLAPFDQGPFRYAHVTVTALAVLTLLLLAWWRGPAPLDRRLRPMALVTGLFVLALLASVLLATDLFLWRYGLTLHVTGILFGAALLAAGLNSAGWGWVLGAAVGVGVLQSAWGLIQSFGGFGEFDGRAYGSFSTPNLFAGFVAFLLVCLLALFTATPASQRGRKLALAGLLNLHYGALVVSGSRGGWVALLVGVVALGLLWRRSSGSGLLPAIGRRWALGLLASLALTTVIVVTGHQGVGAPGQRLEQMASLARPEWMLKGSSQQPGPPATGWGVRLRIWESAWTMITAHPLGVGLMNFSVQYPRYKYEGFLYELHHYAHNDYLQLWTEVGPAGPLLLLLLVVLTVRAALRRLGAVNPGDPHAMGLPLVLAGLTVLLTQSLVDFGLYTTPYLLVFWGLLGYLWSRVVEAGRPLPDLALSGTRSGLARPLAWAAAALWGLWVLDPYLATMLSERGAGLYQAGRLEEAGTLWQAAAAIDPVGPSYHHNLALVRWRMGALDAAQAHLEAALRRAPYDADSALALARLQLQRLLRGEAGRWQAAETVLRRALTWDPLNLRLQAALKELAELEGQGDRATGRR
ncbi:MAG: O-antigen ligase family protein [Deltaproteobacteria bacterium]|nr:O-antigen ligase family protein [Deltaproteobacteria bacterium]